MEIVSLIYLMGSNSWGFVNFSGSKCMALFDHELVPIEVS